MGVLTGRFDSLSGRHYRVTIASTKITTWSDITLAADPVHLSYTRGETKYEPVRSMMCKINVVTEDDLSVLYSDSPYGVKVEVMDDTAGKKLFTGYLMPAEWRCDARPGLNIVTLNAVDVLGMLKYKSTDNSWRVTISVATLWSSIFTELNFDEEDMINTYSGDTICSVDALLPDDHKESKVTGSWPDYRQLLECMGRYTNTTTMIWGGVPMNVNIDKYDTGYWQSSASRDANANVLDNNMTMEIVPARSSIEYVPDGDEKVWINDIMGRIDADKMQRTGGITIPVEDDNTIWTFSWASLSDQIRSDDIRLQNTQHTGAYAARANIVFWFSYGAEDTPSTDYNVAVWGDLSLLESAKHTVFKGQNLFVRARVYVGTVGQIYPTPWQVSAKEEETQQYDSDGNARVTGAHLALKVNGAIVWPQYVDNSQYNEDFAGFYEVGYNFFDLPSGKVEPVIMNQSTAQIFIQQLEVIGGQTGRSLYYGAYSVTDEMHTGFYNPLQVVMPLMGDRGVTLDYKAHVEGDDKTSLMEETRSMYRQQYAHYRRLFRCSLPIDGFTPWKKVRWSGYKCTIDAADLDLRRDKVTVELLESY